MMALRSHHVALVLTLLPLAGCGTIRTLHQSDPAAGTPTVFNGVRDDLARMKSAKTGELHYFDHVPSLQHSNPPQIGLFLAFAADVPFSFVGDILTWPYRAAYVRVNEPVPPPTVGVNGPPTTQSSQQVTPPKMSETLPTPAPSAGLPMPKTAGPRLGE